MKHSAASLSESVRDSIYGGSAKTPDSQPISWLEREQLYKQIRKEKRKGYVQIDTSRGINFTVQLHCDVAPIACDNFLRLVEQKYYVETIFHRLIQNFMIQGGDPTGTGKGGMSAFGKPFPDEIDGRLVHDSPGVLSMANSGAANDNKSQFFFTFAKCPHLDNKHTVFGKIVGGLKEFMTLNFTPTDGSDRPLDPIRIKQIIVLEDPFTGIAVEADTKKRNIEAESREAAFVKMGRSDPMAEHPNRRSMEIGKYLVWPERQPAKKSKRTTQPWSFENW